MSSLYKIDHEPTAVLPESPQWLDRIRLGAYVQGLMVRFYFEASRHMAMAGL